MSVYAQSKGKIVVLAMAGFLTLALAGVAIADSSLMQGCKDANCSAFGMSSGASDSDGDGLSDADEERYGSNPYVRDTDKDGYSDGAEIAQGKDPLRIDTFSLIDEDHDGLTSEDEGKYNTDPINPDSDLDGYLDGEEIASGHNPRAFDTSKLTGNDLTKRSLVAGVEKDIIEPLNDVQDLTEFRTKLEEQLGKSTTGNTEISYHDIPDSDLKLSSRNDKAFKQDYIKKLLAIFAQYSPFKSTAEVQAFASSFRYNDTKRIDDIISRSDTAVSEAKKLEVPEEVKDLHKRGLQIFLAFRDMAAELRDLKTTQQEDLLKVFRMMAQTQVLLDEAKTTADQAMNYASQNGVPASEVNAVFQF